MTQYLMAVHGPVEMNEFGNYGSQEEMEKAFAATDAFNEQLKADGYWVFAGGLEAASAATVVDGQGETPVMTDGPYLESKELIGGFAIIDVGSLAEAVEHARTFALLVGTDRVDVRKVVELEDLQARSG